MLRHIRFIIALAVLTLGVATVSHAQIQLDLRNVDLKTYVELVAEKTGTNYILDPEVDGRVTVFAPIPISSETLFEIFLNVLEANNLTIVKGIGIQRVVPIDRASTMAGGGASTRERGTFETRIIPVNNGNVDEILEVIEPLVPQGAILTAVNSANLIVVSDRRENIDRIEELMRSLSKSGARRIEAVRLKHASASDLLPVLRSVALPPDGESLTADTSINAIVFGGPDDYRARLRVLIGQLDQPQSRVRSKVVRLKYAQATELATVIRESLTVVDDENAPFFTLVAEPQTNSILVSASGDRIGDIVDSIRALDVRPAQVLIEVVIFEISAENFSEISSQFGGILNEAFGGGTSFQLDGGTSLVTLISAAMSSNASNVGTGIGGFLSYASNSFVALITAIARERSTRLLSTPAILTLNNQEAEIVVAQNVPFVTGQYSTVGNNAIPNQPFQTIERQDVGLKLTVLPQITDSSTVRITIKQEVSSLTGSTSAAGGEVTSLRRISTNALVQDGQVIILGGLIEDAGNISTHRVPGLSKIPALGKLFRGRGVDGSQRVLLVMLRPRVMNSSGEASRIGRDIARRSAELGRRIAAESATQTGLNAKVVGLPFDGIDLNQPFEESFVDRAVRDRLFPALPPRLTVGSEN